MSNLFRRPDKIGENLEKNGKSKLVQIAVKDENKLVLALLGLAIVFGFQCLILLFLVGNNRVLATRGKVYVQQPDGSTQLAREFPEGHRENEVLQKTVITWIKLTFEWDNRIPGSDENDQGIEVEGGKIVPTKAYLASYLLESGFRTEFLKLLSQIVPPAVFSGTRTSTVLIYNVSTPRQIAQTTWEVDVISTRVERGSKGELREVKFNRTFTLKAIVPAELALGKDEPLAFRHQVNELLKNGVMITKIVQVDY